VSVSVIHCRTASTSIGKAIGPRPKDQTVVPGGVREKGKAALFALCPGSGCRIWNRRGGRGRTAGEGSRSVVFEVGVLDQYVVAGGLADAALAALPCLIGDLVNTFTPAKPRAISPVRSWNRRPLR